MSRNYINYLLKYLLLWVSSALLLFGAAPEEGRVSEDTLIIKALLHEQAGKFAQSRKIYEALFLLSGKKEYLIQEAKDALLQKSSPDHSIDNLVQWISGHPQDRDVALYRMLVALYMEQGSLVDAENVADAYLSDDTPMEDQLAVAALKVELNKPEEAVALLQKAYAKEEDEKVLSQLVGVWEQKLMNPKKAIALLAHHIETHKDASVAVYFKLIELYAKEKNLKKVSDLYKMLYEKDPQKYFLQKIIEISLYRKDIDGVIDFLEKNRGNEEILFTFYREKKAFGKAEELAQGLYDRTHDVKWLAEEGMLVYEKAKQSGKVADPHALKKMQMLMERALSLGLSDPLYLNYYGYTLIDHDLDIDRGIELVEKALESEGDNTYYLDSLAWGLYKKGRCDRAYEIMKRVVDKEGLSGEEIRMHWDLIRKCHSKS